VTRSRKKFVVRLAASPRDRVIYKGGIVTWVFIAVAVAGAVVRNIAHAQGTWCVGKDSVVEEGSRYI
jgi:hypothetical protein